MDRYDFITSKEDVVKNIKTLYSYLGNTDDAETYKWATGILKNGRIYVAEIIDSKLYFAPSRFVGYKDNTAEKHQDNHGDGNQTNDKLVEYYQKVQDERLDAAFQYVLKQYDLSSGDKKYWIPKDMTIEQILSASSAQPKQYWVGRVTSDEYWEVALSKNVWVTQQRYGRQKPTAVSGLLGCVKNVKAGDIIFLTYGSGIYAYGNVIECPIASDQISNLERVIQRNKHDYHSGIVRFDDNNVFYEDLTEGCDNWGQRITVDQWHYYSDSTNVTTGGMRDEITMGVTMMSFIGITEKYGNKKIKELKAQYENKHMFISKTAKLLQSKHNIILQGAPGTGKTYNTVAIALAALDVTDVDLNDHKAVMKRYNSLLGDQIFFTTFHQSLDYEDFVEGLKPHVQTDADGNSIGVTYEPEDGIFKRACNAVQTDQSKDIVECIDDYLQKIKGYQNKREIPTVTGRSSLYVWWEEGNSKVSSRRTNSTSSRGEEYTPSPLNIEKIKLQALGKGCENNWPSYALAFIEAVKKEYHATTNKPVVLIIDEINRGNVSKIFGELITLLESDKRSNGNHPIKVMLPYTKGEFGVPSNLYIIGTMNTTDRSTGTLDYALRRRFAFVTLKSQDSVIKKYYSDAENEDLGSIAVALFADIKKFIENPKHFCGDMSIDDLMVGHSYFMAESEDELQDKVEFEIIPLINEYINDGILNVKNVEKNAAFDAWRSLNTIQLSEDDEQDDDEE